MRQEYDEWLLLLLRLVRLNLPKRQGYGHLLEVGLKSAKIEILAEV